MQDNLSSMEAPSSLKSSESEYEHDDEDGTGRRRINQASIIKMSFTSSAFLHLSGSLYCTSGSFLFLLLFPTTMKVFHHNSHEHV
jgi:hypothetical protein